MRNGFSNVAMRSAGCQGPRSPPCTPVPGLGRLKVLRRRCQVSGCITSRFKRRAAGPGRVLGYVEEVGWAVHGRILRTGDPVQREFCPSTLPTPCQRAAPFLYVLFLKPTMHHIFLCLAKFLSITIFKLRLFWEPDLETPKRVRRGKD